MGEIAQGPRRAADTGLDPVSVRLSTDTIGPVWWKSGCRKRAYGICKYGEQAKSPYESMTLIRKNKKGFWQLLSIIKNRNFSLQFFFTLIRTKILSLQYPQGLLWKILFYIAFLLLEPLRNSGQIVNTQVTTCMSAYVLRGRDSVVYLQGRPET